MIFRILPAQRKENETEIVRRGPVAGFGKPVRPNRSAFGRAQILQPAPIRHRAI